MFFICSHFENVIRLVVERARQIPRHHLVLFWHHAMEHLFSYLLHTKL